MNDLFNATIKPYKFPKDRPIRLFDKQAGNSIVVNVLEHIFKEMI